MVIGRRTNGVALLDVELKFDFAFYGVENTELRYHQYSYIWPGHGLIYMFTKKAVARMVLAMGPCDSFVSFGLEQVDVRWFKTGVLHE